MGLFLFCCISDVLISSTFSGSVGVRGAEGALRLRSLSREPRGVGIHFHGSAFLKGASGGKIGERLIKGDKCKFWNERIIKH